MPMFINKLPLKDMPEIAQKALEGDILCESRKFLLQGFLVYFGLEGQRGKIQIQDILISDDLVTGVNAANRAD